MHALPLLLNLNIKWPVLLNTVSLENGNMQEIAENLKTGKGNEHF